MVMTTAPQRAFQFLCTAVVAVALAVPASASAMDVVLAPLASRSADAKAASNITSLIGSELDFSSGVDHVEVLDTRPSSLNAACLRSTSCLKGIAESGGGDHLVTGNLVISGSQTTLDLVLYSLDTNKIVRTKQFVMPVDSAAIADRMTAVVYELMNGDAPPKEGAGEFSFDDGGDDLDFEEADADAAIAAATAAAEEESRAAAAAASAAAAAAAEAAAADDEFDPNAFTFGDSEVIEEDEPGSDNDLEDEEEEDERVRPDKAPRERKAKSTSDPVAPKLNVYVRGGYAPFQALAFVTAGVEAGIGLGKSGLQALVGFEIYNAYREIPPRFTEDGLGGKEWNTMVPINLGLAYQFQFSNVVKPYIGGDFIFAQFYNGTATGTPAWTVGGRGRLGANFMVSKLVGINLNFGIGYWGNKNWVIIQQGMNPGALLFQASAGVVFAI